MAGICHELGFQLSVAAWMVTVLKNQSQLPHNALTADNASQSIELLEGSCSRRIALLVRATHTHRRVSTTRHLIRVRLHMV